MTETTEPEFPKKKSVRLIVPSHYHSLGYQDYAGQVDLSDTPYLLKNAGTQNGDIRGMTLLFRGRKLTIEEENITFKELIEKVRIFDMC